jgi:hypothetical protein
MPIVLEQYKKAPETSAPTSPSGQREISLGRRFRGHRELEGRNDSEIGGRSIARRLRAALVCFEDAQLRPQIAIWPKLMVALIPRVS